MWKYKYLEDLITSPILQDFEQPMNQDELNIALRLSVIHNKGRYIWKLIDKGANDWNGGLYSACANGFIKLLS